MKHTLVPIHESLITPRQSFFLIITPITKMYARSVTPIICFSLVQSICEPSDDANNNSINCSVFLLNFHSVHRVAFLLKVLNVSNAFCCSWGECQSLHVFWGLQTN